MNHLIKTVSGKMIADEPVNIVHNFLALLTGKVQAIAGQVIESEIYDITLCELEKDIRIKYNTFTLPELEFAMLKGAKGEYGEYYGLNMKTFTHWLNEYRFSPERLEAVRQRTEAAKQLPAKTTVSQPEIFRLAARKALDDLCAYKNGKQTFDMGCTTYNFLTRLGLLRVSADDKWRLFRKAETQIREEKKKLRRPGMIFRPTTEMTERDKQTEKNIICERAKKLALKEYFREITESNTDFELLLQDAATT